MDGLCAHCMHCVCVHLDVFLGGCFEDHFCDKYVVRVGVLFEFCVRLPHDAVRTRLVVCGAIGEEGLDERDRVATGAALRVCIKVGSFDAIVGDHGECGFCNMFGLCFGIVLSIVGCKVVCP